jgi:hypothetical protein
MEKCRPTWEEYLTIVQLPLKHKTPLPATKSALALLHEHRSSRFALINLPETVKGAMFPVFEISEISPSLFLDEFRGDVPAGIEMAQQRGPTARTGCMRAC